jgi:hypothetical protein
MWIIIASWVIGYTHVAAATGNDVLIGIAVAIVVGLGAATTSNLITAGPSTRD